ncbi:MAG: hypothetical protein WCN95_13405 [bacterium]
MAATVPTNSTDEESERTSASLRDEGDSMIGSADFKGTVDWLTTFMDIVDNSLRLDTF